LDVFLSSILSDRLLTTVLVITDSSSPVCWFRC